ncbi:MAG: hypothetical protein HYZ71_06850 [Deltaproteobacteria bacterium]|nr:hypothetical protein [Deltaproteobacteria bacterium]
MRSSLFVLLLAGLSWAAVTPAAKTLYMRDTDVARVTVKLGQSTILSFPTKPSKVVLGGKNVFGVEYIDSDLAISALIPHAHSNLVVYLPGRRFSFDLSASTNSGDEILLIRDAMLKRKKKVKK